MLGCQFNDSGSLHSFVTLLSRPAWRNVEIFSPDPSVCSRPQLPLELAGEFHPYLKKENSPQRRPVPWEVGNGEREEAAVSSYPKEGQRGDPGSAPLCPTHQPACMGPGRRQATPRRAAWRRGMGWCGALERQQTLP